MAECVKSIKQILSLAILWIHLNDFLKVKIHEIILAELIGKL